MSTVIVPAYNPDEKLLEVIKDIKSYNIDRIIVVNDGSKKECDEIFNSIKSDVILLTHEINKGKGVALKTAMKYIKELGIEDKVLTIDADGQHKMEDGIKLLENLESGKKEFVTGSRTFKEKIPLKNRIGNVINSYTFMLLSGKKVNDTLNGLRAFNTNLIEFLLEVEGERYEYEMNVLMTAARDGIEIDEPTIELGDELEIEQLQQKIIHIGNTSKHTMKFQIMTNDSNDKYSIKIEPEIFILRSKEAIEIEDRNVSMEDQFREYPEWNSLAYLSIIAMLDEEYDVQIEEAEFKKLRTVGDLYNAIKK